MSPRKTSAVIRIRDTMQRYGVTLADLQMWGALDQAERAARPEVDEPFRLSAPIEPPRCAAREETELEEEERLESEDYDDEDWDDFIEDNRTDRLFR